MRADLNDRPNLRRLAFYASQEHACGYLPGRRAVTLFADPGAHLDNGIYSRLADYGFRRSGAYIYQPSCPQCDACIPVRIPVDEFTPRRSEIRTWRRNRDLAVHPVAPDYHEEHFALYRRYVHARHRGSSMDHADPEKYLEFLTSPWSATTFYEFRHGPRLLGVAVVDRLEQSLSAVYTFFDPEVPARGLGTYAILWEIEEARRLNLRWLYLGYWIRECPKMSYKGHFRPMEIYRQGQWRPYPEGP
ncbi:MAG: arginyltransferase [Gammaproteobacteria bacterium]|nr:arginyltransferase [Gammaproteobacteria bacterium]